MNTEDNDQDSLLELRIAPLNDILLDNDLNAPPTSPVSEFPKTDQLLRFNTPTALSNRLQYRLFRRKHNAALTEFELYLESPFGRELVLDAKKKSIVGSNYAIFACQTGEQLADISCSNIGTCFVTTLANESKDPIAQVVYERNLMGHNGPRSLSVFIPGMNKDGSRVVLSPAVALDKLDDSKVVAMKNKLPQWNQQTQSFVLNFNGRVSVASVKNFQIVHPNDLDYIVMQFGRISHDEFTLDVRYPLSPLQAFSIALSSFGSKIGCE